MRKSVQNIFHHLLQNKQHWEPMKSSENFLWFYFNECVTPMYVNNKGINYYMGDYDRQFTLPFLDDEKQFFQDECTPIIQQLLDEREEQHAEQIFALLKTPRPTPEPESISQKHFIDKIFDFFLRR